MEVINNKSTEQAIYEKNKAEFEAKFGELKAVSDEVKKQKEVVNELFQRHNEKIITKVD